jgi:GntR family transcriptional regulator
MTAADHTRYQRIADTLRVRIVSGELAPGARLASERALSEEFGVSRPTLREAIKVLRAEGLVIAAPGAGLFVREAPHLIRNSRNRLSREERARTGGTFAADMASVGLTHYVETKIDTVEAGADIALLLDVDEGSRVVVRERRMWGSGTPMQFASSYFPADIAEGTPIMDRDTGHGGVYARLEEMGHRLVSPFVERISVRIPSRPERMWFGLDEGVAILVIHRIARTAERVVEVNRILLRGDRYELEYEIAAD